MQSILRAILSQSSGSQHVSARAWRLLDFCKMSRVTISGQFSSAGQAKMHVVEFLLWTTGATPPAFNKTDYTLQKLKKLMACERPEGRRLRTGFTVPGVASFVSHRSV